MSDAIKEVERLTFRVHYREDFNGSIGAQAVKNIVLETRHDDSADVIPDARPGIRELSNHANGIFQFIHEFIAKAGRLVCKIQRGFVKLGRCLGVERNSIHGLAGGFQVRTHTGKNFPCADGLDRSAVNLCGPFFNLIQP